jgi:UDP-N-acetyl-2-amino-2-deoxyglucuronate dehydrogenase
MAKELGFGLLGAGLVAPFHARSLKDARGGKLVAICDSNQERAKKLASTFPATLYAGLDDMLRDPAVDVVNVLTPNHLHHDAVIACAKAGKHVITEKPPAMSLAETDAMVEACRKAGVRFGCTVQCRVRKAVQAVKQALAEGRFGRVLHADAYMKFFRTEEYYHSDPWRSSRRSGAGVTVQHAFHYIDLLVYLAGPFASVEAKMTNLSHPSVKLEDTLISFVTYRSGAQGVVQASTAMYPGTDIRVEINGTAGTAVVVGERIDTWKFREERPGDEAIRKIGSSAQSTGATGPADFGHQDHQIVIQDMIDAIREGREPVIPVTAVRPTVEAVLAMYQSSARGRRVELPVRDDPSIWEM